MKTTAKQPKTSQAVQAKVNKQDSVNNILQRYKDKTVQLQSAEEEELLQGKFETAQKMDLDEEEPIQGKFETTQLATEDEKEPLQRKPNNTGLPDNLKSGIENLSGYSMDDVKVHYNSSQPATLQAHAYAQGTDIHIASGQEKHLPHEAWHVVQQKQGRVKPTMQMKGTVPVNNDAGLEKEADVMGVEAQHGVIIPSKSTSQVESGVIQRKEIDARIEGLTHLVLAKGNSIFEGAEYMQVMHDTELVIDNAQKIRSRRGPNQEIHTETDRRGSQNNRWIKVLSVDGRPLPDNVYVRADTIIVEDTRDIAPSRQIEPTRARLVGNSLTAAPPRELSPEDMDRWNALNKYTTLTVAASEKQPISKNQNFDHSTFPKAASDYIDQFRIISKTEFENKISEIALGIMELADYSCIVSEVGKSNFWITGKVLDQVRRLGGIPPKRVISLPVKEKGAFDRRKAGEYAAQLQDAGHIVFIDDGSYSGSQLVKFINHVIGEAHIPHSIGLVAATEQAMEKTKGRRGTKASLLAIPYNIETFSDGDLDKTYRDMGLPVHHDNPDKQKEPRDGNALAGLHYKIPDYASVRHRLLVGSKDSPAPFVGYSPGSGLPVRVHGTMRLGYQNGSEPYKSIEFLKAIATEESLESLGIEDPTNQSKGTTTKLLV